MPFLYIATATRKTPRRSEMYMKRTLALCLFALTSTTTEADVWSVDCDGTGDFVEISEALSSPDVVDGDSLSVHTCAGAYAPFEVMARNDIHIVAADEAEGILGAREIGVGLLPFDFQPVVAIEGDGVAENCVEISESSNIRIEGFAIENCAEDGIDVDKLSSNITLAYNRITDCGADGIHFGSDASAITGNMVLFNGNRGIALQGEADDNLISDNVVGGNNVYGIRDDGVGNNILNNMVRFNLNHGIRVSNGSGLGRIDRNTVLDNDAPDGVEICVLSRTTVIGNDVGSSGKIYGSEGDASCADNSTMCEVVDCIH